MATELERIWKEAFELAAGLAVGERAEFTCAEPGIWGSCHRPDDSGVVIVVNCWPQSTGELKALARRQSDDAVIESQGEGFVVKL